MIAGFLKETSRPRTAPVSVQGEGLERRERRSRRSRVGAVALGPAQRLRGLDDDFARRGLFFQQVLTSPIALGNDQIVAQSQVRQRHADRVILSRRRAPASLGSTAVSMLIPA